MKTVLLSIVLVWSLAFQATLHADEADMMSEPPLLDGPKVTYFYQTGWGAHIEFYDGQTIPAQVDWANTNGKW